jgi:hypothetical protein
MTPERIAADNAFEEMADILRSMPLTYEEHFKILNAIIKWQNAAYTQGLRDGRNMEQGKPTSFEPTPVAQFSGIVKPIPDPDTFEEHHHVEIPAPLPYGGHDFKTALFTNDERRGVGYHDDDSAESRNPSLHRAY